MSEPSSVDDGIAHLIADLAGAPGILTGYVLYAEYLDSDGDQSWIMSRADGQSATTSLGMVETLRMILRHEVQCMIQDDE